MPGIDIWKQRVKRIKTDTLALYLAYQDARTPWYAKVIAGLVLAYTFSPIDLIPDFIPILGYLDDLILVPLGVLLSVKLIPAEVMAECRIQAQTRLQDPKPVNRWGALVIVLVWIGLVLTGIIWIARLLGWD